MFKYATLLTLLLPTLLLFACGETKDEFQTSDLSKLPPLDGYFDISYPSRSGSIWAIESSSLTPHRLEFGKGWVPYPVPVFREKPHRIVSQRNGDAWLTTRKCNLYRFGDGAWELVVRDHGGTINDPTQLLRRCDVELVEDAQGYQIATTGGAPIDPGSSGRNIFVGDADQLRRLNGWNYYVAINPNGTVYGIDRDRRLRRYSNGWRRFYVTAPGHSGDRNGDDIFAADGDIWVLQREARRIWHKPRSGSPEFCTMPKESRAFTPKWLSMGPPGRPIIVFNQGRIGHPVCGDFQQQPTPGDPSPIPTPKPPFPF